MQIPVLNGIYTDTSGEFRTKYPRNYIPVPLEQGISKGYLKPADGIALLATGPGKDRGAINWNGSEYRASGDYLIRVEEDGSISVIGSIPGTDQVTFDYSFDRLAVCSNGVLYYFDGATLTQVIDTDLGRVIDFCFIDGYFATTDGNSIVVTELNDPMSVNPLKYGSSEAKPDAVKRVLNIRDELCAVNRYSIEFFNNVGGSFFPFQRVKGALINRGAVGTHAACEYTLSTGTGVAFVGGNSNEPPSVWFGINGASMKLATREIDTILQQYNEDDLNSIVIEARVDKAHDLIYIHLPDQTLVYDSAASQVLNQAVWFALSSAPVGISTYQARNLVWAYGRWNVGDPTSSNIGYLTNAVSSHWGNAVEWEFGTLVVYNEGNGAIFHELELVALPGNVALGADTTIYTSYSIDGVSWSQEKARNAGAQGKRNVRLNWLQQGNMRNWRIQKFRGKSDAHLPVVRLNARLEPLYV